MNIYQLKQEFLDIVEELENNGGELTPELESALAVNQNDAKNKIKSYIDVIKSIKTDIDAIENEKKRLTLLKERKTKTIDKLTNIVIDAIKLFGDTKKSGVKFIDLGTSTIAIRKSSAVTVNEDVIEDVGLTISDGLTYLLRNNQIDVSNLTIKDLLDSLAYDSDAFGNPKTPVVISADELKKIRLKVNLTIPVEDLETPKYDVLKGIIKNYPEYTLAANIDKMEMKKVLSNGTESYSHIAHLTTNEHLKID